MGLQFALFLFLLFLILWLPICLCTSLTSSLAQNQLDQITGKKRSVNASQSSSSKSKEQKNSYSLARKSALFGLLFRCYTSPRRSSSWSTLSSAAASASFAQANSDSSDDEQGFEAKPARFEFNRIDCLVWELHESARSFSLAVESLKLTGSGPELSMAWVGKDVHGWHKRISYMVAVLALLKTAIEMEVLLSRERHFNNSSPVKEILTPKINLVGEYIENQLNAQHSSLFEWFREVELPRIAAFFIPLLKKWSMKYAGRFVPINFSLLVNEEVVSTSFPRLMNM